LNLEDSEIDLFPSLKKRQSQIEVVVLRAACGEELGQVTRIKIQFCYVLLPKCVAVCLYTFIVHTSVFNFRRIVSVSTTKIYTKIQTVVYLKIPRSSEQDSFPLNLSGN